MYDARKAPKKEIPQEKPKDLSKITPKKRPEVKVPVPDLPEDLVKNFKDQILRALEDKAMTVTELAESMYGREIPTSSVEWQKVYRVVTKLRKESLVDKRATSRGVEYYLEGGDPPEEVD